MAFGPYTDSRGERGPMPRVTAPTRRETPPDTQASVPISREWPPAARPMALPEPIPPAKPGFYVVPYSMSVRDLHDHLFDTLQPASLRKISALNPGLGPRVKAGTMIVLGDPNRTSCTFEEAQLQQAAHQVSASLESLSPGEADFMMTHGAVISAFTGNVSTWSGVTLTVLEKHLTELRNTLQGLERLHQQQFAKYGHLHSPEFFSERRAMIAKLDAHLLNSRKLRQYTTLSDNYKLKNALGISSRSLVHSWKDAGGAGRIPGYADHVAAVSRAAKYMKAGGFVGIGIGGISSMLAVQEVCSSGSEHEECRRVRFTEGGKFMGSVAGGYLGGEGAYLASGAACVAVGISTGPGGILCVALIGAAGVWAGATIGSALGEVSGNMIYKTDLQ